MHGLVAWLAFLALEDPCDDMWPKALLLRHHAPSECPQVAFTDSSQTPRAVLTGSCAPVHMHPLHLQQLKVPFLLPFLKGHACLPVILSQLGFLFEW